MVLGEVLEEETRMKDVGDDRLNYNDPQDVADGQYFD